MGSRLSVFVAGLSLLAPTYAQAEPFASSSVLPAAYHVQLARGMLPSQHSQRALTNIEPLPDSVKEGIGCLVIGSAGTFLAAMAGGEEILNVIAGGGLPPTSRAVYMTGLLSVVFVSFCAVGQTMTPLYTHLMTEEEAAPPHKTIEVQRHSRNLYDAATRTEGADAPSFRASLRHSIVHGSR